jgi:tRNA(fMet)-specific endonuclease VapC
MGITLDTSVLIELLRGDPETLALLDRLEGDGQLPTLSTVAVFETLSGVEFTKSRSDRVRLENLLRQIPLEEFDLDSARKAGELRAELLRAGNFPGAPDVMIAGHALASGHTLVTRDRSLAASSKAMGVRVVDY